MSVEVSLWSELCSQPWCDRVPVLLWRLEAVGGTSFWISTCEHHALGYVVRGELVGDRRPGPCRFCAPDELCSLCLRSSEYLSRHGA